MGWFRSLTRAVTAPLRATVSVAKHAVTVARNNKLVKGVALAAATVYTGGLAAGALTSAGVATGATATALGTGLASGAVSKVSGNGFNLKNSIVAGATAGLGASKSVLANNIGTGIKTVQAVKSLSTAVEANNQAKADAATIKRTTAEIAQINAQIAAEQKRAAELAKVKPVQKPTVVAKAPAIPPKPAVVAKPAAIPPKTATEPGGGLAIAGLGSLILAVL